MYYIYARKDAACPSPGSIKWAVLWYALLYDTTHLLR